MQPRMRVDELMTRNSRTLLETDALAKARQVMESSDCRGVPVVDEHGGVVGMVSARDLVHALATGRGDDVPIATFMARAIRTVRPNTPAHEALRILLEAGVAGLPVIDGDDRLVGMVTESDFLGVAGQALREPRTQSRPVVVDAW